MFRNWKYLYANICTQIHIHTQIYVQASKTIVAMIQYGQYHIEIIIFALQVENIVFDKRIIQKSCF